MLKPCKQCNNPFEASRSTALFCSERCKKIAQRSGTNDELSGTVTGTKELTGTELAGQSLEGQVSGTVSVSPQTDPRKVLLTKEQLSKLSEGDKELYERYLNTDFSFTPNWIIFVKEGKKLNV